MSQLFTKKSITHLSFSRLKAFQHSPRKLRRYITEEREQTAAMIEGRLIDCILFTPDRFANEFLEMPDVDRRTKAGKETYQQYTSTALNTGLTLVESSQVKDAHDLAEAVTRVSKSNDQWVMEIGRSKITALPLGDGEKLRGFRFQRCAGA